MTTQPPTIDANNSAVSTVNNAPVVNSSPVQFASLVYRYAAYMVDGLIVGFFLIPFYIIFALLGFKDKDTFPSLIEISIVFIYYVYLTRKYQATWGKKYFNIKVETLDGQAITWGGAIRREVLGKILSYVFFSLGFFWAVIDKKKQAWHDKIANTIVVQTEPLSKGRKFLAYFLTFGLVILAILGILAVIILVAINPQKQLQRTRDAGRIAAVVQMGHAIQAYYARNQNYPGSYSWSTTLVSSGELENMPNAINYSSGQEPCSTNLVNDTWCYNSTITDTIVFAKLENDNSKCKGGDEAYTLFSQKLGRGGAVCSSGNPLPSSDYNFVQ